MHSICKAELVANFSYLAYSLKITINFVSFFSSSSTRGTITLRRIPLHAISTTIIAISRISGSLGYGMCLSNSVFISFFHRQESRLSYDSEALQSRNHETESKAGHQSSIAPLQSCSMMMPTLVSNRPQPVLGGGTNINNNREGAH